MKAKLYGGPADQEEAEVNTKRRVPGRLVVPLPAKPEGFGGAVYEATGAMNEDGQIVYSYVGLRETIL